MARHPKRWRELPDEALERLLVERWLSRGRLLLATLLAAIAATWIGTSRPSGLADTILVGVLAALVVVGAVGAFVMRLKDHAIRQELRRRHRR